MQSGENQLAISKPRIQYGFMLNSDSMCLQWFR